MSIGRCCYDVAVFNMCRCIDVRCLDMFNVWRCSNCGDVCSMYVNV